MRFRLLVLFSFISFSASAQWWHVNLSFKKHEVLPLLKPLQDRSVSRLTINTKLNSLIIPAPILEQSQYGLEADEADVMRAAKHNMRFRVYKDASYNFSDLGSIYIKLHRLSEAKWYFLQSNNLSRQQNDNKHTILNLISLAEIKVDLCDNVSARADLVEARDIAKTSRLLISAVEIDDKIQFLDQTGTMSPAGDQKFADANENRKKAF